MNQNNPCINGDNEACAQIMGGFLERIYERYPKIVAEELRKALEVAEQYSPQPTSTPVSATPIPSPTPAQPTPSPAVTPDANAGTHRQEVAPSENKFQNLNNILNQERLTKILPTFTFIDNTDLVDLQALVMEIRNSQKESSFPERLSYFLSNPQHLELLKAYRQALNRLAESSLTEQSRHTLNLDYEQVLRNFASELRFIQQIVENRFLIGGGGVVVVVALLVIMLWSFLTQKRSRNEQNLSSRSRKRRT